MLFYFDVVELVLTFVTTSLRYGSSLAEEGVLVLAAIALLAL